MQEAEANSATRIVTEGSGTASAVIWEIDIFSGVESRFSPTGREVIQHSGNSKSFHTRDRVYQRYEALPPSFDYISDARPAESASAIHSRQCVETRMHSTSAAG